MNPELLAEIEEKVNRVSGIIGADDVEQISVAMADLTDIKEFTSLASGTITELNNDVERLNIRNQELQIANNKAMRQLHTQNVIVEGAEQQLSNVKKLASMF